jgi:hypothetical protein
MLHVCFAPEAAIQDLGTLLDPPQQDSYADLRCGLLMAS